MVRETVDNTHIPERLLSRVGVHDEFWSSLSSPAGQVAAPVLAAAAMLLVALLVPSLRRIQISAEATAGER